MATANKNTTIKRTGVGAAGSRTTSGTFATVPAGEILNGMYCISVTGTLGGVASITVDGVIVAQLASGTSADTPTSVSGPLLVAGGSVIACVSNATGAVMSVSGVYEINSVP